MGSKTNQNKPKSTFKTCNPNELACKVPAHFIFTNLHHKDALMNSSQPSTCPCGSHAAYSQCCGLLHTGAKAKNAEQLMRSRYSAYVLEMQPYLLATWHESSRPSSIFDAPTSTQKTHWLGLAIKNAYPSSTQPATQSHVEFIARYKIGGGGAQRLHEVSRFILEENQWFYVDGEFPA